MLLLQPILSASVLDHVIQHDKKYPAEFITAENCVEMQVCYVAMVTINNRLELNYSSKDLCAIVLQFTQNHLIHAVVLREILTEIKVSTGTMWLLEYQHRCCLAVSASDVFLDDCLQRGGHCPGLVC